MIYSARTFTNMNYHTASLVSVIIPSINISISFSIFVLTLYHFLFERKRVDAFTSLNQNGVEAKARKSVLMILMFSFMATISTSAVVVTNILGLIGNSSLDSTLCTAVLPKLYSTTYVFANACLYEFLNTRSEVVKTASDNNRYFQYLRFITKLLARVIPFLVILTLYFWKAEIVIDIDGKAYCVDALRWELSTLFACLSIPIAFLFLVLFIWPLYQHYSKVKASGSTTAIVINTEAIVRVVKKNTALSLIAMSSTMIAMIIITYLSIHAENRAYNNIGITIANTDLTINLVCMTLMTDQWLPKALKKAISFIISKDSIPNDTSNPQSNSMLATSPHAMVPKQSFNRQQDQFFQMDDKSGSEKTLSTNKNGKHLQSSMQDIYSGSRDSKVSPDVTTFPSHHDDGAAHDN